MGRLRAATLADMGRCRMGFGLRDGSATGSPHAISVDLLLNQG